jgi:hypothetical protein
LKIKSTNSSSDKPGKLIKKSTATLSLLVGFTFLGLEKGFTSMVITSNLEKKLGSVKTNGIILDMVKEWKRGPFYK